MSSIGENFKKNITIGDKFILLLVAITAIFFILFIVESFLSGISLIFNLNIDINLFKIFIISIFIYLLIGIFTITFSFLSWTSKQNN